MRIIADYDVLVRRNLARGYTAKQMHVPFLREQAIRIGGEIGKVKERVKRGISAATKTSGLAVLVTKSEDMLKQWSDQAEEAQSEFLSIFNRHGPLRTTVRKARELIADALSPRAAGAAGKAPKKTVLNSSA